MSVSDYNDEGVKTHYNDIVLAIRSLGNISPYPAR